MDAKKRKLYYTPSELLEMYPQLRNLYTPQTIGYLALGHGVNIKKLGRQTLVDFEDFAKFLHFRYKIVLD